MTKELKLTDALLGASAEIPTLDGPKIVKIPPGVKKLRLKGLGLPSIDRGSQGNLYVEITVDTPKRVTDRQRKLLEELRNEGL